MVEQKFLVMISVAIGLVPIVFGIVGLATSTWISPQFVGGGLDYVYGLFQRCSTLNIGSNVVSTCDNVSTFRTVQSLEIVGVATIALGVIIAIGLRFVTLNNNIHLLTPLLPMIGSILILIGLLLYAKYVIEDYMGLLIEMDIGYSMILMVISCICGFLVTVHFSFYAGYVYRDNRQVSTVT